MGRNHDGGEGRTPHPPDIIGFYYRDNFIEPIVVPYARWHGNAFIFQDDNARTHRAGVVQDHLQFSRLMTLPKPVKSPDLPPIEHVWDVLGKCVRGRPHKPQDINELGDPFQEKWRRTSQASSRRFNRSMRRSCLACLAAKGSPIRY